MTTATITRYRSTAERLATIADPAKRWELTRRAMRLYLTYVGEVDKGSAPDWIERLNDLPDVHTADEYADRIDDVRRIAAEEWIGRDGSNCTEGTNRFLDTFGIDELSCEERESGECDDSDCSVCHPETTKIVTVSVTITLRITNTADDDDTYNDVEHYLRVDVGGNVDDVDSTDVQIDSIDVETDY